MNSQVQGFNEREARLRNQANVYERELVSLVPIGMSYNEALVSYKFKRYNIFIQTIIKQVIAKIKKLRRQADECRMNAIWRECETIYKN